MEWQIATQTHRGNVRAINEDALLAEKAYPLLVVADGMGGHEAGEVASRMLIDGLATLRLADTFSPAAMQLEGRILRVHDEVREYARRKLGGKTVGSTVVAMLACDTSGICLWAGDSRLYRVRDRQLEQLTEDHSFVAELVRAGELSAADMQHHPSANVITRALGASAELKLDNTRFEVRLADTYLLCSDGLHNEVSAAELLQAMLADDVWQSSNNLLQLCLSRRAKDNVSFILARPMESGLDEGDATLTYYPSNDDV